MKLLQTDTLETAREKLWEAARDFEMKTETVSLEEAYGRVCAKSMIAPESVPAFRRSTVDGYAIKARDSFGAGDNSPVFFDILGNVDIDMPAELFLDGAQAIRVQTGSMVPEGADAVLMAEYGENYAPGKLAAYKAVSVGENVTQVGEDVKEGAEVLSLGKLIDAYDLGILAGLGICRVEVFVPLRVTIISTGDELISPDEQKVGAKIRDMNTYTLAAKSLEYGMTVVCTLRIKDEEKALLAAVAQAMTDSDMVVLSGGSSKGNKDYTEAVFEHLSHNILTHGIAIKPGKPTLTAYDIPSKTILLGLPGHPMAAVLMYALVAGHWLTRKLGLPKRLPYTAILQENVSSNQGRETVLLVALKQEGEDYLAYPIYAKSGHISCLTRADGYTRIPRNQEGLKKGTRIIVEVL